MFTVFHFQVGSGSHLW